MFPTSHGAWLPVARRRQREEVLYDYEGEDDVIDYRHQLPAIAADQDQADTPTATTSQLATRFARMLTLRESRVRQRELDTRTTTTTTATTTATMTKRHGPRSCDSLRRSRRRQRARMVSENAALQDTIRALQEQLAQRQRSQALAQSQRLVWRQNRTAVVVDIYKEYFRQFACGYDTANPARAAFDATAREFMYSVTDHGQIVCRDSRGVENLLRHWEAYTRFHDQVSVRLVSISLIEEEDKLVSICGRGEMKYRMTELSLQTLYPAFYARAQTDRTLHALARSLVGKECVHGFDKVFHFNNEGFLVAHETKLHLASGIMAMVQDPFAAMALVEAASVTDDGHWRVADDVQEEVNELPKLML